MQVLWGRWLLVVTAILLITSGIGFLVWHDFTLRGLLAISPRPAWREVAGVNCQALHDSFVTTGPDGQTYPTWHPPSLNGCHFGHEHGDDPSGSPALNGRTLPFGFASRTAGLDEPHPGFKVFRWDHIPTLPNAPNHAGASVLFLLHQGSSGPGRFTTPHHDLAVHYRNPDGRELHLHLLAPFGTLLVGCGANDPNLLLNLRQAHVPGARQLTASPCFDPPFIPYEDWLTALYVGLDPATGRWRAYLDPHFAIFGPNTYCEVVGLSCQLAYSDVRARTGADPSGVAAHYKGTKREAYLNQVWLDNAGNDPVVWTDVYGRLVAPRTPGAIAQWIAPLASRPFGDSLAFGADRDHDDGSVHAPN
jgi:hypothetical protein